MNAIEIIYTICYKIHRNSDKNFCITTRGFKETDFVIVGELLNELNRLAIKYKKKVVKNSKDFKSKPIMILKEEINSLKSKVNKFSEKFEFVEDFNIEDFLISKILLLS